ncbi:MAG: hypothetical protein K0Q55_1879 [Verrucomicrobia bacterium]|jgi:hypothetical protein|nr:hypothetical protein [Verrucomicrobiota bacterium]
MVVERTVCLRFGSVKRGPWELVLREGGLVLYEVGLRGGEDTNFTDWHEFLREAEATACG